MDLWLILLESTSTQSSPISEKNLLRDRFLPLSSSIWPLRSKYCLALVIRKESLTRQFDHIANLRRAIWRILAMNYIVTVRTNGK